MAVNEAKNAPEEVPTPEEEAFKGEGSNTELLAVRVQPAVMLTLRTTAEKSGKTLPELVRHLLMSHMVPRILEMTATKILEGERAKGLLQNFAKAEFEAREARLLLANQRETMAHTRRMLDKAEQLNASADERLKEAQEAAAAAWLDYITAAAETLELEAETLEPNATDGEEEAEGANK